MNALLSFLRRTGSIACGILALSATVSHAQTYPVKPVRLIVPFAPGGPNDQLGRLLSQKLIDQWKQQLVIENRGGANTIVGMSAAAKAAPDGYTLVIGGAAITTNPSRVPNMPYNLLRDFAPITNMVSSAFVLIANPSLQVRSVEELIRYARASPGQLNYGSGGDGSPAHLSGVLFDSLAGTQMTHIAYQGIAPAVTDLLAGRLHLLFMDPLVALPHVKAGKLRLLAVTDLQRFPELPEVPSLAESGLSGYDSGAWRGLLAPAGTPAAIINRIHDDVVGVLSLPDVRVQLTSLGSRVVGDTPAQFSRFLKSELVKWEKLQAKGGG